MFCKSCGAEIKEGEKYCPNCGSLALGDDIKGFKFDESSFTKSQEERGQESYNANTAENAGFESAGPSYGQQAPYGQQFNAMPLKTDRSLLLWLVLCIVTCGIYGLIFIYELSRDVNIACEGDGEETPGLLVYVLLSLVTCGIYSFIWYYKLAERLAKNCYRYGHPTNDNGVAVLLWMILGYFLCGIGPFIAEYIIITNVNTVCAGYNSAHSFH